MTHVKKTWTFCNRDCGTKLTFATRAGTTRVLPYEYQDREPFSEPGLHVLIDGVSFTPGEAIEHFQTRGEGRTEDQARELVSGYPFHRPHICDRPTPSRESGTA